MESFFDRAKILARAGKGGDGAMSFRREKFVPHGGPDGGNGGQGGDVYLVVDPHLNTLFPFRRRRHFRATAGGNGRGKKQAGKKGEDLFLPVPPGTIVHQASGEFLADLTPPQEQVLVARGGRGGRGNAVFATPTHQVPRLREKGEPGEEQWLLLELKLIADVGIMGLPNAGKSTLLSQITRARPKIADYPFTTLSPNLGVVELEDHSFVVVDIPGLIEGAHKGKGLGHNFLRHIERTRLLVHLLDGSSLNPIQDYETLRRELVLFKPELAEKLQVVAVNKMDLPAAQKAWPRLERELANRDIPALPISALTGQGVRELLLRAASMLETIPRPAPMEAAVVFRPQNDGAFTVEREGRGFRIKGKRVERAVARTDWQLPEAIHRLRRTLEAMGVTRALVKAGIKPGDTVYVGDQELEWGEGEPIPQ